MSIRCGHCGESHETIDEVRVCAESALCSAAEHPSTEFPHEHPVGGRYGEEYPDEGHSRTPMHCGREMIPIVSGYPGPSLIEARDKGEIQWTGTCMVFAHQPNWHCPSCGRSFTLPGGPNVGGLASVRMDGHEIDWDRVPDPPWWTKVRMRLQYWITGDV